MVVAACSATRPTHQQPPPPQEQPSSTGTAEETPSTEEPVTVRFEAGEALLAERGLTGVFVVRREGEATFLVATEALADEPFVPASTFKIPNTIIGLETGVITDEHFTLPWDGERRQIEAWNRDHDLTSALAESVVWYYQEVARRVGLERMRDWVERLGYGNGAIGDEVDTFWLDGPLAITPREQVVFLERLTSGGLPISERTRDVLERVMPSYQAGDATLRAKTGTYIGDAGCHAWLVGWAEEDGEVTAHFAQLLRCDPDHVPPRTMRWELAEALLGAAGVLAAE